jgi:hypothetical protein
MATRFVAVKSRKFGTDRAMRVWRHGGRVAWIGSGSVGGGRVVDDALTVGDLRTSAAELVPHRNYVLAGHSIPLSWLSVHCDVE